MRWSAPVRPDNRFARDVLTAVAELKGRDHPFGAIAHDVLGGHLRLRDIAYSDIHGQAIAASLGDAIEDFKRQPLENPRALDELRERLHRYLGRG